MVDTNRYYETWAPYWSYFENNYLDIEGIQKLSIDVVDPVLVIGAGQGLLVEQLIQKGLKVDGVDLSPQMIRYAKDRRNIDLIHADARELPFAEGSYKTVIVATGVVDFMEDEQQIADSVAEARRVTDTVGKTLLAFYRIHPTVEKLMRSMGTLTGDGYWRCKRGVQYFNMRPWEALAALRKELNVGLLHVLSMVLRSQILLPKKERRAIKSMGLVWKKVRTEPGGAERFIEVVPELVPYRGETEIRSLLERLNEPIQRVYPYDSCTVVLLSPKV